MHRKAFFLVVSGEVSAVLMCACCRKVFSNIKSIEAHAGPKIAKYSTKCSSGDECNGMAVVKACR